MTDSQRYALQAREVLEKQRARVVQAAEALMQHVSFIRESDVRPDEWGVYLACKEFVEARKKPPARETSVLHVAEERRA